MKKVILILFIFNLELCCALCYFRNLHQNHKVIEINDHEILKQNNISLENEENDLNIFIEESYRIKDQILKEMKLIDQTFDDLNTEITNCFKKKQENLIKKENDIKDSLKNEITKIKEKLEIYYSEIYEVIKKGELSSKIIKSYKKNKEEKIPIKELTYISFLNKANKEIQKHILNPMKNIKISYNDNEEIFKFEEYYLNGIKYPKMIELGDISAHNLKISWKYEEKDNPIKIDLKKIKFRVEIRKENPNDNFIQAYEGYNNSCLIDDLEMGTNYEIRICSIYEDSISTWCPIQKFATLIIDSEILLESKREKEFVDKILEWSGYKNMELIYRGTRDGTTSLKFHEKCDNQGPTICLYKNEKGYIFGGYASVSWSTTINGYYKAPDCFIFTLTNIHNIEPTKFKAKNSTDIVFHGSSHGPHFGGDIKIFEDFNQSQAISKFPDDYEDCLGKGKSIFTGDQNNNNGYFKVKEIEVFKMSK